MHFCHITWDISKEDFFHRMMECPLKISTTLQMEWWKKIFCYYVIYSVYDVTNKILSHDSNYIMDVVMWPKFGNSSICIREVIITSNFKGFDQKNRFFWGVFLVQVQHFGTGTRCKFSTVCQRVKTKSQKVFGPNYYVCRSYRGKTGTFKEILSWEDIYWNYLCLK